MPRKKKQEDTGAGVSRLNANLSRELGKTGLKQYSGRLDEEFLQSLKGDRGLKAFREMSENDPVVSSMLFAIEMLIRQVSWDVEPAGTEKEHVGDAEFLESCLWDMDTPFTEIVSEILTMLPFGFSLHELVYKVRRGMSAKISSQHDDGKIGWRRLPIRAQDTIDRWEFGEGGDTLAVVQVAPPDFHEVTIPAEKFINFRTTCRRGNPEGRSVLRGAYRPWWFKKRIEEFEAIGVERDICGIPFATVPVELLYDGAGAREKALLAEIQKIVRNIRMDSQVGVVFPAVYDDGGNLLYDLKLLSSAGTKQFDTSKILTRYDQRIAMTVLADFILLGHEKVGSFALASSKTEIFATALGAWCDTIAETFNRDAIPRLMEINGRSAPYPNLVHGDIESPDLAELGAYITAIAGAGAELFPDDKLERHLRRVASLPEPEKE